MDMSLMDCVIQPCRVSVVWCSGCDRRRPCMQWRRHCACARRVMRMQAHISRSHTIISGVIENARVPGPAQSHDVCDTFDVKSNSNQVGVVSQLNHDELSVLIAQVTVSHSLMRAHNICKLQSVSLDTLGPGQVQAQTTRLIYTRTVLTFASWRPFKRDCPCRCIVTPVRQHHITLLQTWI